MDHLKCSEPEFIPIEGAQLRLCSRCKVSKDKQFFRRFLTRGFSAAFGYAGAVRVEPDTFICNECLKPQARRKKPTKMSPKELHNRVATGDMTAYARDNLLETRHFQARKVMANAAFQQAQDRRKELWERVAQGSQRTLRQELSSTKAAIKKLDLLKTNGAPAPKPGVWGKNTVNITVALRWGTPTPDEFQTAIDVYAYYLDRLQDLQDRIFHARRNGLRPSDIENGVNPSLQALTTLPQPKIPKRGRPRKGDTRERAPKYRKAADQPQHWAKLLHPRVVTTLASMWGEISPAVIPHIHRPPGVLGEKY